MAETYEEIVKKWYLRLRGDFTDVLMQKYRDTDMRLADVENIYQDVFIAIHKNLKEGRIQENTSWEGYIMKVGLNMASKRWRTASRQISVDEADEDSENRSARAKCIADLLITTPVSEDEENITNNPEAYAILGEELNHIPETCASIIRMSYYDNMSDTEIAVSIPHYRDNGKSVKENAKAIKARRWLCMRDLIYRVKLSLYTSGIIDEKPEKTKRNGK